MKVQGVLQVIVLIETEEHDLDWTKRYVKSGITTAFPGLRSANLAIQIVDEDDTDEEDLVLCINKLGRPTPEMEALKAEMFSADPIEAA